MSEKMVANTYEEMLENIGEETIEKVLEEKKGGPVSRFSTK